MLWFLLPDDIKEYIKLHIIKIDMSITSKHYFNEYYDIPNKNLLRRSILNTIRNDHEYVFKHLFFKYYNQFKKTIRYRYDGKTYKHFADFLKYRVIDQQAMRCKIVISEKLNNEYKWT
jgi:hypothetical protein